MSHNHQKKIAVINDFSGFGRCSIAVALPIISAMKIQCCPIPTAIFSNHTGFESYFFNDYTQYMEDYFAEWKKLDLRFEGICTGFLGSTAQIEIVIEFLKQFQTNRTITIVDPVMGDYGKLYPTYTMELAREMKRLVRYADILTPNLTEICILTDTPYTESLTRAELLQMCEMLSGQKEGGPSKIVISGLREEQTVQNFVYEKGKAPCVLSAPFLGENRSGTGDVFSAVIAGAVVNGTDFCTAVQQASDFITETIAYTIEQQVPLTDGICFEQFLSKLSERI